MLFMHRAGEQHGLSERAELQPGREQLLDITRP